MRSITITTYPSMPGRFRVECEQRGMRGVGRDASSAGEAAAVALNYAAGSARYVILGHEKAIEQIPVELRSLLS